MISMIYASSLNGVIGRDGRLPWRLATDMRRFKRLTAGGCLVMGRRTWESLGNKPLPGRSSIVLTYYSLPHDYPTPIAGFYDDNFLFYVGGEARFVYRRVLRDMADRRPTWIIGGASVFARFLPHVDRIHWTRVEAEAEGDTVFDFRPDIDPAWRMIESEHVPADEGNEHPSTYMLFERR